MISFIKEIVVLSNGRARSEDIGPPRSNRQGNLLWFDPSHRVDS